ncbi:hypothetical protein [Burkholderia sp. Ac-20349]|uniref:hypothetical protein n=1 Tax=Burkholderia sp. Ac-20349 TaxID=2703893 RepID=UPI00197BDADF|nr:hypothetical protein [Burkholderia sp. Ac-20349]MBN3839256.1 hypothetical protein [Burkholderia sp. Ac-20349]
MSKGMGVPRGKDVFGDLERNSGVIDAAPPAALPEAQVEVQTGLPAGVEAEQGAGPGVPSVRIHPVTQLKLPVKEATQTMSLKVPKSLYDDMRDFAKLTDIPMSHVLVEGARAELARLKKRYGI